MYVPPHFAPTAEQLEELLASIGAADLISSTARGLMATFLPMVYDPPGTTPTTGPAGSLLGHFARKNEQWREPALGEALAIVRGRDGYISPAWYATKREHGRVVPTWNYVVAHLYGAMVIHDDPAWVEANVRRLSETHEAGRPEPWSVDDAPQRFIEGQLRAIVGVELRVTRIEAKLKLSQNRSPADVEGAIAGLEELGDPLAGPMRAANQRG